ncbi:MAG TPA: RluA family pseudouridine synthase, partial [Devosia sp.]|nr:RluA family pseudouridine synthase [Devosia sp.]
MVENPEPQVSNDGQNEVSSWQIVVEEETAGGRLDIFLAKALPDLSRTRIKQLILAGEVHIDGVRIGEPKLRVKPSMVISLTLPPPTDPLPKPQDIALDIVYEDDQLIIINKPAGMVVHPAPGAADGTLVNALIHHCGDSLAGIGGVKRPGIVHRLDKNTTGIMVVAKSDRAHKHLAAQFADHGRTGPLTRNYVAFVWGHHQGFSGTINVPLGRDPRNRLKQGVRKDGRIAITHFKTLARYSGDNWHIAKIQCSLETGRTHQIRVHMAHVGHPVIGDPTYGTGFATKSLALPDPLKSIV